MAKKKAYSEMTTAELRVATREFDDPGFHPPALPMGKRQREEEREASRLARSMKAGRPRIGLGAERIQIAMERGLRLKIDAYARKHGMTRSRLLAEAAKKFIAA